MRRRHYSETSRLLQCRSELAKVRVQQMKLTNENFQTAVKVGGMMLMLGALGNVYFLLRHREVYRDATRTENRFQQQFTVFNMQQSAFEGVIREFATRLSTDAGVAEVFQRHRTNLTSTSAPATPPVSP